MGGGSLADLEKETGKNMLRDVPKERDPLLNTLAPQSSEATQTVPSVEQASRQALVRYPGSMYWLIARRNDNGRLEVLPYHRPRRQRGSSAGLQP